MAPPCPALLQLPALALPFADEGTPLCLTVAHSPGLAQLRDRGGITSTTVQHSMR